MQIFLFSNAISINPAGWKYLNSRCPHRKGTKDSSFQWIYLCVIYLYTVINTPIDLANVSNTHTQRCKEQQQPQACFLDLFCDLYMDILDIIRFLTCLDNYWDIFWNNMIIYDRLLWLDSTKTKQAFFKFMEFIDGCQQTFCWCLARLYSHLTRRFPGIYCTSSMSIYKSVRHIQRNAEKERWLQK